MPNENVYSQAALKAAWGPRCTHHHHEGETEAWLLLDGIMRAFGYAPKQGQTFAANCRPVTNGTTESFHAEFGDSTWTTWTGVKVQEAAATDFNSSSNPYSKTLVTDMPREMVDAICAIRTNNGRQVFHWGGYFSGNKDAMHFEFGCTPADLATGINMATVYGAAIGDFMAKLTEDEQQDLYKRVKDVWAVVAKSGYIEQLVRAEDAENSALADLTKVLKAHVEDEAKGGGAGQVDDELIAQEIIDAMGARLSKKG